MRRRGILLAMSAGIAVLASGCEHNPNVLPADVTQMLRNADRFEVISLDPGPSPIALRYKEVDGNEVNDDDHFHGWPILGRVQVSDRGERRRMVDALGEGIAAAKDVKVPACFVPRLGIHAERGQETVDLLICYQCAQVQIIPSDGPFLKTRVSSQPILNKVLEDAGVPLAPKWSE